MANGKEDAVLTIRADDKSAKGFKSAQKNLQNLASSAAVLQGPLGAIAGRINAFGAALGRMGPAAIVAGVSLSTLILGLVKMVKETALLEVQTQRMNAVIKATDGAVGLTAKAIDDYAYSLAELTLASQEGARNAAVTLTTYTSVAGDQFKRTLALAQDYVAVFGGDLSAATIKFGRALDNPREGLQSLSRQFTAFDPAQRAMIASLFESGRVVEAQEQILGALEARIGGAGTGTGLIFTLDTLGERFTRLITTVGAMSGATSVADDFFATLSRGAKRINDYLDPSLNARLQEANDALLEIQKKQQSLFGFNMSMEGQNETVAALRVEAREAQAVIDGIKGLIRARDTADKAALAAADLRKKKDHETALQLGRTQAGLAAWHAERKQGIAIYKASLTPTEQLNVAIEEYGELIDRGVISSESGAAALRKFERAAEDSGNALFKMLNAASTPTDQSPERILTDTLNQRRTAITRALEDEGYTGTALTEAKNAAILNLERQHTEALATLHMARAQQVIGSTTSILDSLASIYGTKTQVQKDKTNDQYQAMADGIERQVDAETITRAQGDAKLNALEAKRVQAQNANAKKTFETGKKLQRASATITTAAGVTAALADATVPTYVRFANAAAVAVSGAAQIAAINATSFDGGGGVGAVGSSGSNISTPKLDQGAGGQGTLTVQFLGDFYGWDQYMQERVIGGIRDAVDNRDVTIIGNSSRQAQELRT